MSQTAETIPLLSQPRLRAFAVGTASAASMRVSAMATAFASTLIMARCLGFSAFGEFAFALATVQLLNVISKFGLDNTSLRFISLYRQAQDDRLLGMMVRCAANTVGLCSCTGAALLAAATLLLRPYISGELLTCLLLSAGVLVVLPLTQVYEATLLALGRVLPGMLSPVLTPLLFIICLLAARSTAGTALSSASAMLLYTTAALAAFLAARAFLRHWLESCRKVQLTDRVARQRWLDMALPMMFMNILVYVQGQSGTILCGLFLSTGESGLFSTISKVAGVALFGLQSVNTIASPRMAELHGAGETEKLQDYVQMCSWSSLAFALPVALAIVAFGHPLLHMFGPEFVVGYRPLLVLLFGLLVNAGTGPVAQLLYMTGYHTTCLRLYAVVAAAVLVLQVVLIPQFGVMGAAISTSLVQIFWNLALVQIARSKVGVGSVVSLALLARQLRKFRSFSVTS